MKIINMPDIPLSSAEDWEYYTNYDCREYIEEILESLQRKNRFFVDFRFQKLLMWFSKKGNEYGITQNILYKNTHLYRARIYDERDDSEDKDKTKFGGYGKLESFVPPESVYVKEGRANPSNVRYLYASTSCCNAIAEVNPSLKIEVSVADIVIKEDLQILSFDNFSASSTAPETNENISDSSFASSLSKINSNRDI